MDQIKKAAEILRQGGIIVYPTATVYCLGGNIFNQTAVQKVASLEDSFLRGPLPIMVNSFRMVENLAYVGRSELMVLQKLWPGPTTVLLFRKANLFPELVDQGKIALRFSNDLASQIIEEAGFPITALPAFNQARLPILQPDEVDLTTDLVVKGICQFAELSTIVDLSEKKIVRSGVEEERVRKVLQL